MLRIEDLYDVPPVEIELSGGLFDGRRMRVPDERETWLFPVPPDITEFITRPGSGRDQRRG